MSEELTNNEVVEEVIANEEMQGQGQEEIVEDTAEQQEQSTKEKDDNVPLATLLEEKKRRKELERQLREIKEKDIDKELLITKEQIKRKYIEKGWDADAADTIAEDIASVKAEVSRSKLKDLDDSTLDDDLKELARDGFYADATAYKKEIAARISEYKAKGIDLTAEEAYMGLRGKLRFKEMQTELEQKAALKRREGEAKAVPTSSAAKPKDQYPLTASDIKALEGLQKAMPDAGWNKQKFYEMMVKPYLNQT